MPYTMEDFQRQYVKEHFRRLTPKERREAVELLPPEERRHVLEWLPPEERRQVVQSLPPEERREVVQSLPPEERREVVQSLPPEERLAGLSAEQIQQYLDQLTGRRKAGARASRGARSDEDRDDRVRNLSGKANKAIGSGPPVRSSSIADETFQRTSALAEARG